MKILGVNEPPAFLAERGDGSSPFFFTCDHASNRIPASLNNLGLGEADLQRHIAWDIGAAEVARGLTERFGATCVEQAYSRLVIDCNRPTGVHPSIATVSDNTEIPGNMGLDADQASARAGEIFHPYHDCIGRLLDARAEAGRPTLLVAVHSFTPVYEGVSRPWHIGFAYHNYPRMARIMIEILAREADLCVGDNEPYSISDGTDYTMVAHGEKRAIPHVQIELRQDLIDTKAGQAEWVERLEVILSEGHAVLAG